MAITQRCNLCGRQQKSDNKKCANPACGNDLVQARKQAKIVFYTMHRIDGRQKWERIGTSLKEAQDANGKRRAQKRENRVWEIEASGEATINELCVWYLNLPERKALKTWKDMRKSLQAFRKYYGHLETRELRQEHIETFRLKRQEEGIAGATIDKTVTYLRAVIKKAITNRLVPGYTQAALEGIRRLVKEGQNAIDTAVSVPEYQALIENAQGHIKDLITLAYWTGVRKGELRALRWKDIDLSRGWITIPAEVNKTGVTRRIPIPRPVEEVLERLRPALHAVGENYCDYVFQYKGKPFVRRSSWDKALKQVCDKAKVKYGRYEGGIGWHAFRHTFVSNLANLGVPDAVRKTLAGHSLEGMDKFYVKISDEKLREAMNQYYDWYISGTSQKVDNTLTTRVSSAYNSN